jgi:hypothetical protein
MAAAGIALAGTPSCVLWLIGSKITAPHPHSIGEGLKDLPFEPVHFPSASGSEIRGWLIPADSPRGL